MHNSGKVASPPIHRHVLMKIFVSRMASLLLVALALLPCGPAFAATPAIGYQFAAWNGECTVSGACTLANVVGPRSVSTTFALKTYAIATPVATGGSITCIPNPVTHGQDAIYAIACAQPHWYALPGATFAPDGLSVTFTLTDNGLGDCDSVPGQITDPGLPVLLAAWSGLRRLQAKSVLRA